MKNRIWYLLLLLPFTLMAAKYQITLPVVIQPYNKSEQLNVVLSGMEIVAVEQKSLINTLRPYIEATTLAKIERQAEQGLVSLEALKKSFIELELDSRDMKVIVSVSVQVMKTADLSYGDRSRYAHPSESANWNILNNVNLSVYDEAGIEQYYDFEWLVYGNVGGSEGVDFKTSWFANNRNQTKSSRRGDIVVSKDFYQRPLRIEVGDVFSASKGYLYSAPIGGIKFSKASKKLQPLRKQSPINEQDFYLPSSAELAVIVNGFVVSRIRLPAGKYSLSDLPLATGNNEVQIKAEYLTGESEIFNFSRFYNGRLLAEGDSDYAVSLGVVTNKTAQEYRYANTLLVNGFFDLGLSRSLTAGASTSVSKNGQLLSLNFSHGLPWGNLASQWSQSHSQRKDGYAFSINSEHSVWGHANSNAPNVRLGIEKKQDFSSAPWSDSSKLQTEQRAYADYTYFVNNQLSFGVNVDHVKRFEDADESSSTSTTAKLNYRIGKFVIAAQYQHGVRSEFEQDNQRFYVNVSWNQYRASNNSLTRLSYLGQSETWQANYNKLSTNMAHDIGYDVLLRQDADENYVSVRSDYQHNWLAAEAEFSRNDAYRNSSESRVSLSSSIALADGVVGIGRNIRTPYAIVKKHQTLRDSQVLINPDSRGKYVGYATDNVAGLVNLGTPYTQSGVVVDVKNAPLGYDIGAGTYELVGANQSAHSILIGSDEAYTVIGYLVDNKDKPIALARGVMTLGNKSWPFFTNKRGRFVVEGVSIGSALLQIGELKTVVELTQQNGNLIILNNLIMEAE